MINSDVYNEIFNSDEACIQRLAHSLNRVRSKVEEITKRIPYYNGWLTIHDISHIDALWEMVDILIHDPSQKISDTILNPLEAYILGVAFYIHDTGMSALSLPNGIESLVDQPNYRSELRTHLREIKNEEVSNNDLDKYDFHKNAISDGFAGKLLRKNHASIASDIITSGWSIQGTEWHLIEDDELRLDWADLIGKIAKSHNDPVQSISKMDELQVARAGTIAKNWVVRPQYLACLLRCADVLQLDHRRAPTLTTAISSLPKESEPHWNSQTKIRKIGSDNEHIIVFSDAFSFKEANTWWHTYDMFKYAQAELDSVDTFLRQNNYQRFLRKRILGIETPESFSKYLRFDGDVPFRPVIKIGSPKDIVRRLGGEQLYGTEKNPPLRELIMNARDAIIARQEELKNDFSPQITIRKQSKDGDVYIEITDNGIGMDAYHLSEILLDFGQSFWDNDKKWSSESIGRYGIGFFSVFMWADYVRVFSRKVGSSLVNVLEFNEGVYSNPAIYEGEPDDLKGDISTKILFKLKSSSLLDALLKNPMGACQTREIFRFSHMTFFDALCGISPISNIEILIDDEGKLSNIPQGNIKDLCGYSLQRRLRFNNSISAQKHDNSYRPFIVFSKNIQNSEGEVIGKGWPAFIGNGHGTLRSVVTIKKFPTPSYVEDFAGCIEGKSIGASRNNYVPIACDNSWKEWFLSCQSEMVGKYEMDGVWARWALKLKVHPLDAKFVVHDPDEENILIDVNNLLKLQEKVYLQYEPTRNYYTFKGFYTAFRFFPALSGVASLSEIHSWLSNVCGDEMHFKFMRIRVPVAKKNGKYIFSEKRDNRKIERYEEVIEVTKTTQ